MNEWVLSVLISYFWNLEDNHSKFPQFGSSLCTQLSDSIISANLSSSQTSYNRETQPLGHEIKVLSLVSYHRTHAHKLPRKLTSPNFNLSALLTYTTALCIIGLMAKCSQKARKVSTLPDGFAFDISSCTETPQWFTGSSEAQEQCG